jgi:hypothetical protein
VVCIGIYAICNFAVGPLALNFFVKPLKQLEKIE